MIKSRLYRHLTEKLNCDPLDYLGELRDKGISYEEICVQIAKQLDQYVSPNTLRNWERRRRNREAISGQSN